VLESIGALERPRFLVFNKIDALPDEDTVLGLRARYPGASFVSAVERTGLGDLRRDVLLLLRGEAGRTAMSARAASVRRAAEEAEFEE
jgi:50S ribosomal subunit-associated GTPase HflX